MATATKKASAKSKAAPASKAKASKIDAPPALKEDPLHPEVHPERHAKSGAQELPTAGGAKTAGTDEPAGGFAGGLQHKVAPNPSIGTTHDENEQADSIARVADDADHVYSYEQALSLPVVDKGTPVKMPSDAQIEADRKARSKKESEAAKRRNETREDGTTAENEDIDLPKRTPVVSFMDKDRRVMLVVKTKDGLGAMPKDPSQPAPNA